MADHPNPRAHQSMHIGSRGISKVQPKIRIIHIYAPEIIQTDEANFRELVQRLTGKPSSSTTTTTTATAARKKISASPNPRAKQLPMTLETESHNKKDHKSYDDHRSHGGFLDDFDGDVDRFFTQEICGYPLSMDANPTHHHSNPFGDVHQPLFYRD